MLNRSTIRSWLSIAEHRGMEKTQAILTAWLEELPDEKPRVREDSPERETFWVSWDYTPFFPLSLTDYLRPQAEEPEPTFTIPQLKIPYYAELNKTLKAPRIR